MSQIYIRKVNTGAIKIYQIVFFKWVIGFSENNSIFNGKLGKEFYIKLRSTTNL